MKNFKLILFTLFIIAIASQSQAQAQTKPWIFGIGWSVIDDNGKKGFDDSDMNYGYNALYHPSAFRVEKGLNNALNGVFQFGYNKYEGFKAINGKKRDIPSSTFLSFDLGVKYNFMSLYDLNTKVFNFKEGTLDIYTVLGAGYTMRDSVSANVGNTATANLGFGMHVFMLKGFGLNAELTSKFSFDGLPSPGNYMQFTFGIVYRLQSKNGLVGGERFN